MPTDPVVWTAAQALIGFFVAICVGLGAWWCKGMATDIKELQGKEQVTQLTLMRIDSEHSGRDRLQDERWSNLNKQITTIEGHMNTVLRKGYSPPNSKISNT